MKGSNEILASMFVRPRITAHVAGNENNHRLITSWRHQRQCPAVFVMAHVIGVINVTAHHIIINGGINVEAAVRGVIGINRRGVAAS